MNLTQRKCTIHRTTQNVRNCFASVLTIIAAAELWGVHGSFVDALYFKSLLTPDFLRLTKRAKHSALNYNKYVSSCTDKLQTPLIRLTYINQRIINVCLGKTLVLLYWYVGSERSSHFQYRWTENKEIIKSKVCYAYSGVHICDEWNTSCACSSVLLLFRKIK